MKVGQDGTDLVDTKMNHSLEVFAMDDYLDELLEWRAAEQDMPEPAEDAFEL